MTRKKCVYISRLLNLHEPIVWEKSDTFNLLHKKLWIIKNKSEIFITYYYLSEKSSNLRDMNLVTGCFNNYKHIYKKKILGGVIGIFLYIKQIHGFLSLIFFCCTKINSRTLNDGFLADT